MARAVSACLSGALEWEEEQFTEVTKVGRRLKGKLELNAHTHTDIYIYVFHVFIYIYYIYVCVCKNVYICKFKYTSYIIYNR